MRATVRGLLVANGSLTALIPTTRWFQQGAVIDVPKKPFGVLQWISPVRGAAKGGFIHQLQVKIYDDRGDFERIDEILDLVKGTLEPVADYTGPDGYIAEFGYFGQSGDLEDVDFRAGMRYNSWQIAGRRMA